MALRRAVFLLLLPAPVAAQPPVPERALVTILAATESGYVTGSGFFVNDTHIVTNEHVVARAAPSGNLFVSFPGSDARPPVTLVSANESLDLALLAYRGSNPREPLPVSGPDPERGAEVFALGFPGPADIGTVGPTPSSTLTSGILSRPPFGAQWGRGVGLVARALQHTAPINPGSSGGPLVNVCGQVIGVNTSGVVTELRDPDGNVVGMGPAQGIFFALAASELTAELQRLGVDFAPVGECDAGPATPAGSGSARSAWLLALLGLFLLTATAFVLRARPARLTPRDPPRAPRPREGKPPTVGGPPGGGPAPRSAVIRFAGRNGAPDLLLGVAELARVRHGISIGRNPKLVDRAVNDPSLSRRHFRVSLDSGRLFVEDLGSTHGTFVNGQSLKPYHARRLDDGDTVSAGGGEWRYAATRSEQK